MLPKLKIILIGEKGVGKTSLFSTFVEGVYPEETCSTIGVNFGCKQIEFEGKLIHLQIWDTSGQERYRKIMSANVDGNHGIMLLYDTTQFKSLMNLFEWLEEIEHANETLNIPMLLVGTKCDLREEKIVTPDIAKNIAEQLNTEYIEISTKDSINVIEAFTKMIVRIKTRQSELHPLNSMGPIGIFRKFLRKT